MYPTVTVLTPCVSWHFFVECRNSSFYSYIGLQLDKEEEETKTSLRPGWILCLMYVICWTHICEHDYGQILGSSSNADGEGNEYGKKKQQQQLRTCISLFCTFLSRRCTTTTQKCLISCFVEDGNTRPKLSFSFPELWYSPLEFNSKKRCQHLTN